MTATQTYLATVPVVWIVVIHTLWMRCALTTSTTATVSAAKTEEGSMSIERIMKLEKDILRRQTELKRVLVINLVKCLIRSLINESSELFKWIKLAAEL